MNLTIKNNKIIISNCDLQNIENLFAFLDYKYCYSKAGFDIKRAIKKSFLKIYHDDEGNSYGILPIGFLSELLSLPHNIISNQKDFPEMNIIPTDSEIKNCLGYIQLYDYQIETIKSCLKNISGICQLPTSAGKTEIFLALCCLLNKKTLILFQRIDLAHQTLTRALNAKLDAGIVQGENIDEDHKIIMTTVQSAHKLKDSYEMVIVDECHHSGSESYEKILKRSDFIYRFGFSATPFKRDKYETAKVKQYLGGIIFQMKADLLIENKKIAEPIIKIIEILQPVNIKKVLWPDAEEESIILNDFRNEKIKQIVSNQNGACLILIKKIIHGITLTNYIPGSVFISGKEEINFRKESIKKFESGEIKCLIASMIFDEGISINIIKNLIIAGGGLSNQKAIQRLGRGLRIAEGKTSVNVFDFLDKQNKITEKHSRARIGYYKQEGFTNISIVKEESVKNAFIRRK